MICRADVQWVVIGALRLNDMLASSLPRSDSHCRRAMDITLTPDLCSASRPAVSCSSSGLVDFGSKAAFSTLADAASEPDLLYSLLSMVMSSLPCASLRAKSWLLCDSGLVTLIARGAAAKAVGLESRDLLRDEVNMVWFVRVR